MNKTYDFLRNEMEDNIKKQDNLNNLIFTILGLSLTLSTWLENIAFIILILFISTILLSRILQCRNTVYCISTYLSILEKDESLSTIRWETHLKEFRKQPYGLKPNKNAVNIMNWFSLKCATIIKNLGNLSLSSFMVIRLVSITIINDINITYKAIAITLSMFLYFLNIIFTITICTDKKMRSEYEKRWNDILSESK